MVKLWQYIYSNHNCPSSLQRINYKHFTLTSNVKTHEKLAIRRAFTNLKQTSSCQWQRPIFGKRNISKHQIKFYWFWWIIWRYRNYNYFSVFFLYDLLLQTWYHCSKTHKLACRYWSNVRGFGPPNQSIKNIFSISNLKNWKLWSSGQSVNHPRHKNKGQKKWMKAEVLLMHQFL